MESRVQKLTDCCPDGHRVRGDASLSGQPVRCPKCNKRFIFATGFQPDHAVVIKHPAHTDKSGMTESSVMRILGVADPVPPPPMSMPNSQQTRPCPKCAIAISESVSVCRHCKTYVGAMPTFMREMR